jgi:hypothetical protein
MGGGEQVMDAGIYTDLSNADYHAQEGWVSSTQLKRLLPETYGTGGGNQAALDFGSALHSKVLGGPSEPIQVVAAANWMSNAAKAARTEAYAAGSIPLLEKDVEQLDAMYEAVGSHSVASELLFGGEGRNELSVFAEVDSVPSKARFDRIVGTTAIDLKTTSAKPGAHNLARAVLDWGYDASAAHYMAVAEAAVIQVDEFLLVFVCKDSPHYVTVVELTPEWIDRGNELRHKALERYVHPQMVDAYEGQSQTLTLTLPRWAQLD